MFTTIKDRQMLFILYLFILFCSDTLELRFLEVSVSSRNVYCRVFVGVKISVESRKGRFKDKKGERVDGGRVED